MKRRDVLKTASATVAAGAFASHRLFATAAEKNSTGDKFKIKNHRIHQSVMGWCFKPMPAETLAKHCVEIGIPAIEGISDKHYPAVKKLGLKVSLVSSHGFKTGPCYKENHDYCINTLKEKIDLATAVGCPSVITFTGLIDKPIDRDLATKNCINAWKQVVGYAEKKKINLCLEHLNSRDDSHPMKGHPGYFGDDVDHCVEMIKAVGSPNMKLLFDVYHVQIMNGDVIRRIRQYKDTIGHYHTAGNPGRGELDDTQEINYPPVMRAILETGYEGYVAQEFIPTWKDPVAALRHAAEVCDV